MFNDLTGRRFGKLIVLKLDHKEQQYDTKGKKHGQKYFWLCQCDCGNKKIIAGVNLLSKHTTSCGCKYYSQNNKTHTRLYKILDGMKGRCNYPTNNRYKNYGAKGIKICEEWNDFKNFEKWAMENGYNDNLTIDRINPNGNYEPSNCRWISNKEQARNKTNNVIIEFRGQQYCLAELAEQYNINYGTLRTRLFRHKWSIEKALLTPVRK